MHVIFFGPPGCGKGTQAKILQKKYGYLHLSSGDMLRAEIQGKSELGHKIEKIMTSGEFVSDALMIQVFFSFLQKKDSGSGIILDGFPRTLNQAEALSEELKSQNKKLDKVISFKVDKEQLVERIEQRYLCQKCQAVYSEKSRPMVQGEPCDFCGNTLYYKRSDDRREAFKNRLDIYFKETEPIIAFYKKSHLLEEIDGMNPVNKVTKAIEDILHSYSQCEKH